MCYALRNPPPGTKKVPLSEIAKNNATGFAPLSDGGAHVIHRE